MTGNMFSGDELIKVSKFFTNDTLLKLQSGRSGLNERFDMSSCSLCMNDCRNRCNTHDPDCYRTCFEQQCGEVCN
jgi:hypothetical protein